MVPLGFYFVHRCILNGGDVKLHSYRSRDTLTNYPPVLRYEVFFAEGVFLVVNGRGTLVVLQPVSEASDVEEAQARYDDATIFGSAYGHALNTVARHLGHKFSDFEDSSLAWFGAARTDVSWRRTELKIEGSAHWPIAVFVEALLIFSACKAAEAVLSRQLGKASNVATAAFVDASKDLILIEQPSDILVNEDEIALLSLFYENWGIERSVRSLQGRFNQVITVLSLHASKVQASHALSLNLLVGCATVLGLLSVVDPLGQMIGNRLSASVIQYGTVGVSLLLAVAAVTRGRFRSARMRISDAFVRRSMTRRLKHLIRVRLDGSHGDGLSLRIDISPKHSAEPLRVPKDNQKTDPYMARPIPRRRRPPLSQ